MQRRIGLYERFGKRLLDILLSGTALLVLSPLLLVTAILVRVKLGSPVIFCQERPGKNEKIFKLHKFRSMTDARDENGELLPDRERLTAFGKALRATSIDELPELFDISRATIRTIRQNLTWALFYNLVSIPVAALGVLHPSICATAMSASSIGVLMHSLRLKGSGKKERRFPWKKKS